MKMITVANPKGGSGKTTTAVELSAILALRGLNILLIDLDPRQDALISCKIKPEGLSLATDLGEIAAIYDFVFVDTPTAKNVMTEQAISLSDALLIPVDFSVSAIRVAKQFAEEISIPYWVLPTHFRARTRFGKAYLENLTQEFGPKLLSNPIHSSVKFAESAAEGTPLALVETEARGLADYRQLAEIFVNQIAGQIQMRPKDLSLLHPLLSAKPATEKIIPAEEGVDLNEFDEMMKGV